VSATTHTSTVAPSRLGTGRTWVDVLFRTSIIELIAPALEHGFEHATRGLPDGSRRLVIALTRATRLWRREQIDVAHELGSHFREGLALGCSEAELLNRFGDVRRTAKMIRRSKRRQRSAAWHALVWTNRTIVSGIALCIVVYSALWARVEWGRPTVTRNYLAELATATPAGSPEKESFRVLAEANAKSIAWCRRMDFFNVPIRDLDNSDMDCARAWVKEMAETLHRVRAAARLPRYANIFSPAVDDERDRIFRERVPGWSSPAQVAGDLMRFEFRGYYDVRGVTRLLVQDAIVARADGDADRMLANWHAMIDLSNQMRSNTDPLARGLSIAILQVLDEDVLYTLTFRHEMLSRDALLHLAHRLGQIETRPTPEEIASRQTWDKMLREDFLQRHFTDDGHGDGLMLPSGFGYLDAQAKSAGYAGRFGTTAIRWLGKDSALPGWSWLVDDGSGASVCDLVVKGLGPLDAAAIAGRRVVSEKWAEADDAILRVWMSPPYAGDSRDYDRVMGELREPKNLRYLAIVRQMIHDKATAPHLGWRWRSVQWHSATLAALAIEMYRRDHGKLPASLQALVPRYLPGLPIDVYDGGPMAYRVTAHGPLLYSVGPDRVDDDGARAAFEAAEETGSRGDIVFFPAELEEHHH